MENNLPKLAIVMGCALIVGSPVFAYELKTHKQLTEGAVYRSTIGAGSLKRLGLPKPIHDQSQRFPSSDGTPMRIDELIGAGAMWEDTLQLTRVFHHFYNPATGTPLSVGTELGFVSPDWALEERGGLTSLHSGEQHFSYRDARRYLYSALTERTPEDRNRNWGLVFQSMGHIVHHIQDMAQPQHTRNDAHCGPYCGNAYPESTYERWTEQHRIGLPLEPLSAGYDVKSERYRAVFNHPRAFWHTQPPERLALGQGLAEFAHRNFVSVGTMFAPEFASPKFDITKSIDIDIRHLMPGTELAGVVRFFGNEVRDDYLNTTSVNNAGLSESIFDPELRQAARQPVFSLNRFNFMAAHGYLLPRAVAHSTGLIDYFFRANFELVRDVDDPSRFRIRNLTDETMNGRFAVYEDDADGKRTGFAANAWSAEIAPDGESAPLGLFPGKGKYMVVFDGTQGAERPENGSLGAVGARAIGQCVLPYDGDLGPMSVRDPVTGQSWQAASVFVVPAGASSRPRVWEVSYRDRTFTVRVEPRIAAVVFAMPRDSAAQEAVTFIDWGLSAEEATQFFLLPGYYDEGPGLHVEEVCNV
jgi:hypothetical protein